MHSMKTTTKTAILSTDELWQWAALKRTSLHSPKPSAVRTLTRNSSQMAQGILNRLYDILRVTGRSRW
jgi:hypothetical protein